MTQVNPRTEKVWAYTRFEAGRLCVTVACAPQMRCIHSGQAQLQIVRGDTAGINGQIDGPEKVVMSRTIRAFQPGKKREVFFPTSKLPPGAWCIRVLLTDKLGQLHHTQIFQHKQPPQIPDWFGLADGMTSRVPLPWTPLQMVSKRGVISVSCWDRVYQFGKNSLIEQVTSGTKPLLARPIRMLGKANGRAIRWSPYTLTCISQSPHQVVLQQQLKSNTVSLRTQVEIDFDGMVRMDMVLSARQKTRIEALTLEMPINASYANHYYQYRGLCGDDHQFGLIPRNGFKKGFRPFIWIGNEDRGLSWMAESNQDWFNKNRERAITLQKQKDVVSLDLHMVSTPVDVEEAQGPDWPYSDKELPLVRRLQYSFGFQATPVKPVEKDAWDYRTFSLGIEAAGHPTQAPLETSTSFLDKLVKASVRTVVVFESWTDIEAHATTTHGKKLKKLVKACHARGLQVLLYFSFLLSESAPEWRDFGDKCVVLPRTGWSLYNYPPQPTQTAWRVCLQSPWQDFLATGIAKVMDEFDIDGVYLDGTAHAYACRNVLHGCGVVQKDGGIAPTYPIFSVRSAMRRIYNVVRSRKPNGQVNVHNSSCMTSPTLGWATSTWDGEQFVHLKKGAASCEFLPLDVFRVEFMGRQWGVPAEFFCAGQPTTYRQAWVVCLLHDVPVRPFHVKDLDLAGTLWKVMDQFGRKEARWLPYWNNVDFVTVKQRGIYVSLYQHRQNGILVMVANLQTKPTRASIQLNLRKLGLNKSSQLHDALTHKLMTMDQGHLDLKMKPLEWKLIWFVHPDAQAVNAG